MEGREIPSEYIYKECVGNHAANLGSYATDGCCEFTPNATGLHCAACSCHRNFHRKLAYSNTLSLLTRNGGEWWQVEIEEADRGGKKRFRTKFTVEQKEKMMEFSEKMGWKLKRKEGEDDEVEKFCKGLGISREVYKVWMHNRKYSSSSSSYDGNASSLDSSYFSQR